MSSVKIVANKVTLKGIINRAFLEAMFILSTIHTEYPSLLDYAEGVAKAGIGLMNTEQETFKITLCHQETRPLGQL